MFGLSLFYVLYAHITYVLCLVFGMTPLVFIDAMNISFTCKIVLNTIILEWKLLIQGILVVNLKTSLRNIHGRHNDIVDRYGISAEYNCLIGVF